MGRLQWLGDTTAMRSVLALWESGEDVRGWARLWAQVYGYIAGRLDASSVLAGATLVLRYEDLCSNTQATLSHVMMHVELESDAEWILNRSGKENS